MNCEEAQELITALIDDELSEWEHASIESHLKQCLRCQAMHQQERALKAELRMAAASVTAPADLREKILLGLGSVPEKGGVPKEREGLGWLFQLPLRPVFVFALLLLLLLPAVYLMRPKELSIPRFALESHSRIVEGTLAYAKETNQEKLKERLFRSVEGSFAPMVYDLSTMGLRPVGGTVQEIGGRKILVTLYEGTAPSLTCFTFLGTEGDVPKEAALFTDPEKQIDFYTFSRDGVNGVMYRQDKVICILVSKLPMGELLALVRAKAQPS